MCCSAACAGAAAMKLTCCVLLGRLRWRRRDEVHALCVARPPALASVRAAYCMCARCTAGCAGGAVTRFTRCALLGRPRCRRLHFAVGSESCFDRRGYVTVDVLDASRAYSLAICVLFGRQRCCSAVCAGDAVMGLARCALLGRLRWRAYALATVCACCSAGCVGGAATMFTCCVLLGRLRWPRGHFAVGCRQLR